MQQDRSPLVARDGEVGDVAEVLRTTGAEARTVLVTGGAGTGKTAVVEQARRAVVQEGARVLRLGWEAAEGPAGADALADTVCGVLARIHDGRLPVRVTAVRRVQLRTAGPGAEVALLSTLGEVLADAARHVPFALVLDNAQRMPARTASALGLLLRVFRPVGVPVVMAGRPMSPGHIAGAQLVAAADQVLELRPLTPADAGALIVRRLGRPVEPDLVSAVSRALGPLAGSPGAVLSVLASLEECGGLLELDGQVCLAVPEGGLRLTADVAELGRLGWPDASPDADTVATAVALARLAEQGELRLDDLRGVRLPGGRLGPRGVRSPDGRLDPRGVEASDGLLGPGGVERSDGTVEAVGRRVDGLVRDRVVTVDPDGRTSFAVPALAAALRTLPDPGSPWPPYATISGTPTDRPGTGSAWPGGHEAAAGPTPDGPLA
ncbi:ATP-binding protein, partial [Streptomyces sp. SID12488]|uniref:AAA family ATPase n=1 Tax=Streptomyces sp. SID12488 TaxID=2706040 RepID=UPI0013DBA083|nr:ATP-binding protein [Streptomyces sp. SID12488]